MAAGRTLRAAALCAAAVLPWACGDARSEVPRNLLLVSIDTLRADHLGCLGQARNLTPRIDALAERSALFTQAFSPIAETLPAHVSILTGSYPHTHGVARDGYRVAGENRMLAELLREAGFHTAGFVAAPQLGRNLDFDQGFGHFVGSSTDARERAANRVTDHVLRWVDGAGAAARDERWMLFVQYFDPHAPYTPPPPFDGRFRGRPRGAPDAASELALVRARFAEDARRLVLADTEQGFRERALGLARDDVDRALELAGDYAAEVAFTDHHLGRLLDGLRERGLLEDTLVVLISDHGETHLEHADSFSHGTGVYDTELHVPLLVHHPAGLGAGRRIERVVSVVDVLPTLLELLEVELPEGLDGRSLAAALDGAELETRPIFAEAARPYDSHWAGDALWTNRQRFQAIRTERYKYMFRRADDQARLFDLAADPDEQYDLLRSADYDLDLAAELEGRLLEWWSDAGHGLRSEFLGSPEAGLRALDSLRDR